jgi:tetratricopeptide (TPR) repeat protein
MLKLNNRNWRFYFTKAIVLKIMGRFEDASDCLALAIAKNSYNNPRAYILQAGCFAYLGEATNAMKNMHYAQSAVK